MKRRPAILLLIALGSLGASRLPWEDMTPADWIYSVATRFADVDGHQVHYPTPTPELARMLEGRKESGALRHLAEAKLALGDRAGALATMEKWSEAEGALSPKAGAEAWAETSRWAAAHLEMAAAFRAAERALPGLAPDEKMALSKERIAWSDRHPDFADGITLRKAQSLMFPDDGPSLETWLRSLEKAGRLAEADQALVASKAMDAERRLLLRSDLLADHKDPKGAFNVLDSAIAEPWSMDVRRAYAKRVDSGAASAPEGWRATLDARFDAGAMVRLATYHQGQGRGDAAAELLRQVERRHEKGFGRKEYLLMARLYGEIDAAPEAFRATLAAAHLGTQEEQIADLAALSKLALLAGGRPIAWGTYNDEHYKWVASLDRTPGFWTGGLSFLLTGGDWKEALAHLENESLPDRTFTTARALADVLTRRNPKHPDLPALRVAIMERHVQRGEGRAALDLLPLIESASPAPTPAVADDARRVALLAARQVKIPLDEEVRLYKARLKHFAANGTKPSEISEEQGRQEEFPNDDSGENDSAANEDGDGGRHENESARPWARPRVVGRTQTYGGLLEESIARLDDQDKSHRASLGLILGEMDRMPDAESLWLNLASRLEGWNLDDDLGPRYEQALKRFQGASIWARTARWYARRSRNAELRRLAEEVASQFRGTELFARANGASDVHVGIPEQPTMGGRVRLVQWADWIRFKALERFPHSPAVFREAGRLVTTSQWLQEQKAIAWTFAHEAPVVIPDSLMEERRWAILFVDASQREAWFADAMRHGTLEVKLGALEGRTDRTPVDEMLLFEGWSRLSKFERASSAADRLTANYPGDGDLARRALSLHRSLNGLETSHGAAARALVQRTAPAILDPAPLWTELGEMEEDRGQSAAAIEIWKNVLGRDTRNPARISELATLLWDYNHDKEALAVVEEGRKALQRPRFFAFETGVLRENVKDLDGAIREYLDALRPETGDGYFSWFERDQRSLRRLAQLLSRDRVYRRVEKRIKDLRPGTAEDEHALAAFLPIATLETPEPGLNYDADDWMDSEDMPNDPKGREVRDDKRDANRPAEHTAIDRLGDALLEKSRAMIGQASAPTFLDAIETWSRSLIEARWKQDRIVPYRDAILARRAKLAAGEEDRIRLETARARYLADNDRVADADAVWNALDARINALPEGSVKLKAEAERAAYVERAKGPAAAAQEWARISTRHPWSLGLLEDRLSFLNRAGMDKESRAVLEEVLPRAASGHKEGFLERLTTESLAASDLAQARRAVTLLLAQENLEESRRLGAIHLQARLAFKENPAWDPYPLAKTEALKLRPELHADLYHELARAADLEKASGSTPGLWIEALNRRTERDWLLAAGRSAQSAGKGKNLLEFFEKQREHSPRDVRWAVAVRDIRRAFHEVDGAIEAAKAAVSVRPEKENLWQEAVDLLVRADRIKEAADYLEGWNRPRPADESVARWRGELYARAGEGRRALAVEQAAIAAFKKESASRENAEEELAQRRARAASRLFELGLPDLALSLYSAKSDIRALGGSKLSVTRQCEIALLTNQFQRLVTMPSAEVRFLSTAASTLERNGRPEQKEEMRAFLIRTIFPINASQPDNGALRQWWPMVSGSGLEPGVRAGLALRLIAQRQGPWQAAPPLAFAVSVGGNIVQSRTENNVTSLYFQEPDLSGLWARDLVRRDRADELLAFMEPRWQELLLEVRGQTPLSDKSKRLWWTWWLDDSASLQAWARAASSKPEKIRELAEVMGDRHRWDRFWVLAARNWSASELVAMLPPESRTGWFRFWEPTMPTDPVLVARRLLTERVTGAVERLVQDKPGAVSDPLIVKLRGPGTVGEVLGHDARWTWAEFKPRTNGKGELLEVGDDLIIGQGADEGRVPGAFWGDRPGEAWYVLESLARYRQGDRTAPYLPFAVPQRGAETSRSLLALRMAQAMGDLPLALELEAEHPGPEADRAWLEGRVGLFVAAGQKAKALAAFRTYVRLGQAKVNEQQFRWLSAHAEDWGLPSPMELFDQDKPVGPAFLAYLRDRKPESAARFFTDDQVGFRAALASRWRSREAQLSTGQIRAWLRELWAMDSTSLPRRGLAKLGPAWAHAGDWLQRQPVADRVSALDALDEALNPADAKPRIFPLLQQASADDVTALLAVRLRLARGETSEAQALVDAMLAELRQGKGLSYSYREPYAMKTQADDSDIADEALQLAVEDYSAPDALVNRMQNWLAPFKEAKKSALVEEGFRKLLKERRSEGAVSTAAWKLAFNLAPAMEAKALGEELEAAWFRGEVQPDQLGGLTEVLAGPLPGEVPKWLARWPRAFTYEQTHARAAILARLKQNGEASRLLLESRHRAIWTERDEVLAFEEWRRLGAQAVPQEKSPTPWLTAHQIWNAKSDAILLAHLKTHPNDVLSARSALRNLAPLDEETSGRVALCTSMARSHSGFAVDGDGTLMRLKAARSLLTSSPRAAQNALLNLNAEELLRLATERRIKTADVNSSLADLARIAHRSGDEARSRTIVGVITDRNAAAGKALRAELKPDARGPDTFRLVNGRPAPIRPRDLTWPMLANLLPMEGVR
ncbi:MAG: hypothetical protein IPP78_02765 [Holophagaceae bacterium]|nr:hypothetical protein [Holophagaceae bacterium]